MRNLFRGYPTPAEAANVGSRLGLLIAIVLASGDLASGLAQGDPVWPSIGRTRWIVERLFFFDLSILGGVVFAEGAAFILRWRRRVLPPNASNQRSMRSTFRSTCLRSLTSDSEGAQRR